MSTEIVSKELEPKTVAELNRALRIEYPKSIANGMKVNSGDSWLTVAFPLNQLGSCRFQANRLRCSWKTPQETITINLEHFSVWQHAESDTFIVEFKEAPQSALSDPPPAGALLGGIAAKQRMLDEEGGSVSALRAAELLRIKSAAVEKRRIAGTLLAVEIDAAQFLYPVWQFELKELERVLAALTGLDSWQKLTFFLNPNDLLDGQTPLEFLRHGNVTLDQVEKAAQSYGDHGG